MAHQAVGAATGAIFGGGSSAAPATSSQTPAVQSATAAPQSQPQACAADMAAFQRCLRENNNQLADCQFFFDAYSACKDANFSTSTAFWTRSRIYFVRVSATRRG